MQLLAVYGITFAVCRSLILERPREWAAQLHPMIRSLLDCMFCSGFWVSFLYFGIEYGEFGWRSLTHAFGGASFAYMIDATVAKLESGTYDHARNHQES